jgi:hypothetical protein
MKLQKISALLLLLLFYPAFGELYWSVIDPSPTNRTLTRLLYAEGKFISVGAGGTVVESTDGTSWIACSTGVTFNLKSVTFYKNKFIAVGDGIIYSENGITWKVCSQETALNDVAAGDSAIVAVGDDKILTSSDGITWSKQVFQYVYLLTIEWGAGKFVTAGDSTNTDIWPNYVGKMLYSPDGTTWTAMPQSYSGQTFGTIDWGDNKFISADQYAINFSQDGLHWHQSWSVGGYVMVPRWACNNFYALKTKMAPPQSELFVYDSLAGWKHAASLIGNKMNDIAWGGGCFVAVGENGVITTLHEVSPVVKNERIAHKKDALPLKMLSFENALQRFKDRNDHTSFFNPLGRKFFKTHGGTIAKGLYIMHE